jgi:DDE superfamily endonuclease
MVANTNAVEMFERLGLLDYGGFKKLSRSAKVNGRRFKSLYGCCPQVCSAIWFDLTHPTTEDDPQLDPSLFAPMHFLMGIRFLKLYETESVLLGAFKQEMESEKALREMVRTIVNVIQALKTKKVRRRGGHEMTFLFCVLTVASLCTF